MAKGKAVVVFSDDDKAELAAMQALGRGVQTSNIVGQLLKFNKGDWIVGKDQTEVAVGTRFVVNTSETLMGWICWENNTPVEQLMHNVKNVSQIVKREDLDRQDEGRWEEDLSGKPRDPWQSSMQALLKTPGKKMDLFTFPASSAGSIKMLKQLGKDVVEHYTTHGMNEYPIVEVGTDSYLHKDKAIGRVKFPTMTIVGWEPRSMFTQNEEETPRKRLRGAA